MKKAKAPLIQRCDWHLNTMPTSYIGWFNEADKRTAAGQVQEQCPFCKLWLFPQDMGTPIKEDTDGNNDHA